MTEEETREQIEEIINNVEEPAKEEPINEEIKEEIKEEELKPKAKPKSKSRAKPKIKITKQPVEPIVEEEPTPVKVDKLKQVVKCPDCDMGMTVHTLKYIHKRRGFCKADIQAAPEQPVPEPVVQQKPKITEDIVNDYIKQNPETVSIS